jgi:hypothetical protein
MFLSQVMRLLRKRFREVRKEEFSFLFFFPLGWYDLWFMQKGMRLLISRAPCVLLRTKAWVTIRLFILEIAQREEKGKRKEMLDFRMFFPGASFLFPFVPGGGREKFGVLAHVPGSWGVAFGDDMCAFLQSYA